MLTINDDNTCISKWAATWDCQQWVICDQQRLRPACAYASLIRAFARSLNILWIFATDRTSFGISMTKRRLHRLVWVYTCRNVTLLGITCRISNGDTVSLMRLISKMHFSYIATMCKQISTRGGTVRPENICFLSWAINVCLLELMLNVPVNIFSVMSGRFLC